MSLTSVTRVMTICQAANLSDKKRNTNSNILFQVPDALKRRGFFV